MRYFKNILVAMSCDETISETNIIGEKKINSVVVYFRTCLFLNQLTLREIKF